MKETKAELSYTFKNGVVFTGTLDQIIQYGSLVKEVVDFKKFEAVPRGYYQSSAKGLIKISDMDTFHIVNSLNKATIQYFTGLKPNSDAFDLEGYLLQYTSFANNPAVEDLYTELVHRAVHKG